MGISLFETPAVAASAIVRYREAKRFNFVLFPIDVGSEVIDHPHIANVQRTDGFEVSSVTILIQRQRAFSERDRSLTELLASVDYGHDTFCVYYCRIDLGVCHPSFPVAPPSPLTPVFNYSQAARLFHRFDILRDTQLLYPALPLDGT